MKKSKLYTKTGDDGTTGLVSGNRLSKADFRIDLYGEIDELNSRIGVAVSVLDPGPFKNHIDFLHKIQSALFDLGSNMACEEKNRETYKLPQLSLEFIQEMENEIDLLDSGLPALKNFILPGGSRAAASLHLCRTSARKVERKMIHFKETVKEELPENGVIFLNRLSDYFFVLARSINHSERGSEISWRGH